MTEPSDPPIFVTGLLLVFLALLIAMVYPAMSRELALIFRIIAALGAAMLAASIPGFFNLEWKGLGAIIRAGGALGIFVLIFLVDPPASVASLMTG